jgi:hypothetical protein
VFGKNLASASDGAAGASRGSGPFLDGDACVSDGVVGPGRVVSSALIACELASFIGSSDRSNGGGGGGGPRSVAVWSSARVDAAFDEKETSGTSLWFVVVDPTKPTGCDVDGGWSDGGTLTRVATASASSSSSSSSYGGNRAENTPNLLGGLDCLFGSIAVPGRPSTSSVSVDGYEFGPLPSLEDASFSAVRRRRAEDAQLECVSPAHAPGVVFIELVPAKSKAPSVESAVSFAFA